MRRVPANRTLDGSYRLAHGEALGTSKGSVALLRAYLTELVILKGPIQKRQFAQLLLLVHVLLVVDDYQQLFHHVRGGIHRLLVVTRNDHV